MTVVQKIPTYESIQWTGLNQPAVETFVNTHLGHSATYEVTEDDTLRAVKSPWFNLFVELNHHVLYGPVFGSDTTQAGFVMRTPGEFTAQFETV